MTAPRTAVALLALLATVAMPVSSQDLSVYRTAPSAAQLPLTPALRATSNEALQASIYEFVELKHATHQAHWNVVGQNFYSLHELLGDIYAQIDGYIDLAAERKRALGVAADARPGAVAQNAGLPEFPAGLLNDYDVPRILSERFYTVTQRVQQRIQDTSDDMVTQDLLIGINHDLEKQLWMLRALQRGGDGTR